MSWNDLSHQEKQNFKIGIEQFSQHIGNESLYSGLSKEDKKKLNDGFTNVQAIAVANQHHKVSDEQFKQSSEKFYKNLFDKVIKLRIGEINQVQVLEQLSEERKKQTKLIDENPVFNDEQKETMKKEVAWESDAVHHLYLIAQSVQTQKEIDPDHIEYLLGALHTTSPSPSTIEVIKTLFNENRAILDEIMKDPSLKEKFIKELTNGENKLKNIQSILYNHPEIKDKLREYGIDIDEEIIKSQKKYGTNIDNKENSSSTPKEYIDKVTNHGELSSTIDQHPNVGEKFNPSESNVDNNDNKVSFKLG